MKFIDIEDPYANISKIAISPYSLKPKSILNAKVKEFQNRDGFLLKVFFKDLSIGYSDCFVFEELSDLPIARQIECLKTKNLTDSLYKSLCFARIDAEFRKNKLNAFQNISLPKNHWTVSDSRFLTEKNLMSLKDNDFHLLKIKCGKILQNNFELIKTNYCLLKDFNFKLRLDFNSTLSFKEALQFLENIKYYLDIIDYVEDPCPFNFSNWSRLIKEIQSLNLALDHKSVHHLENLKDEKDIYFQRLVIKPAQQILANNKLKTIRAKLDKVVFTSYMDHPFGQLCALYEAALFYHDHPKYEEYCGFLTHFLYEENAYSERLSLNKTQLIPDTAGTGFGYDELLEKENWREICEY
ncbi:hypothetical protein [Fluviispira sanaruensis]|uniref:OSBS enolase-like N-terminal domain-containing protein n=1 Tax=Fluviispira sanaruensis TaxID=2493639 RepID=A0A4P2VNM4_FLUSA|nr:hypothetical protein [Fluviispira sanaruensis]BBH54498.1 hypothetical protein JCM31447_29690 [Fluviispira sanaruensis]